MGHSALQRVGSDGQLAVAMGIAQVAVLKPNGPLFDLDEAGGGVLGPVVGLLFEGDHLAGARVELGLVAVRVAGEEVVETDLHARSEAGRFSLVGHRSSPPLFVSDSYKIHPDHLSNSLFHLMYSEMGTLFCAHFEARNS